MTRNMASPTFPAIALPQFENERLPLVMAVALRHPDVPALDDVAAATRAALDRSRRNSTALPEGARLAITCGSRGNSRYGFNPRPISWRRDGVFWLGKSPRCGTARRRSGRTFPC